MGSMCSRLGILGDGPSENVTTHGLRATMISLLVAAHYDDLTIALRCGHRNLDCLKRYHNLRGSVGLEKLGKMLEQEQVQPVKRRKEESEGASTEDALPVKKESSADAAGAISSTEKALPVKKDSSADGAGAIATGLAATTLGGPSTAGSAEIPKFPRRFTRQTQFSTSHFRSSWLRPDKNVIYSILIYLAR